MLSLNDPPPTDPQDASLTGARDSFKPIEQSPPVPRWKPEPMPTEPQVVKVQFASIFWPIVAAWAACSVVTAIVYEIAK